MVTDAMSKQELDAIKATKLATSDKSVINEDKTTGKRGRGRKAKDAQ